MQLQRRVITERPVYDRPAYTRGNSSLLNNISHTPVAHPSTRGVCVGGGFEDGSRMQAHVHASPAEQLLAEMMKLSVAEQKELLDRVAAQALLEQTAKRADRDVAMWAEAVYRAYCSAVGGPGAAGVGAQVFRRLLGAASAWQPVEQFMSSAKLLELPVVDRQAVYNMLADLLVQHTRSVARYTGAPFSVKLISGQTVHVAGLFDNAFPGYLEAGLAHVVARRHQQLKVAA